MVDAVSAVSATQASAASRAATADKIFSVLDPKNTGTIQKSDFLQLYSLLGGGNSAAGADSFGITATSYNVAPTTYGVPAESYVPAEMFLQASSAAVVHAAGVFSSLDTDKSGALSRAEFMAGLGIPAPPATDPNAATSPTWVKRCKVS
jgi:Ca2+-binding EF-hand superfamily protein